MNSSQCFTIMSLQSLEEYYHEVCHNYSLYSAILAIVSEKGSSCSLNQYRDDKMDVQLHE